MASAATCLATILCCGTSSMLQQKGEISLMNHHKKDKWHSHYLPQHQFHPCIIHNAAKNLS
jgi:hypothetical protein